MVFQILDPLEFQTKGIVSLLRNINRKKASGPDGISCWMLKETAEEIAPFLRFIFNQSLTTGQVPGDWVWVSLQMTASYMGLLTTLAVPRCFKVTSTN